MAGAIVGVRGAAGVTGPSADRPQIVRSRFSGRLNQLASLAALTWGFLAQLAQLTRTNAQDGVDVVDAGTDRSAQIAQIAYISSHGYLFLQVFTSWR